MNPEQRQAFLENLDKYDSCRLECDGLSRVLSYLLTMNDIEHKVYAGKITDTTTDNQFAPHFWINLLDGHYIDYRARMWLGESEHIPHGVFESEKYSVKYEGNTITFDDLGTIAPLLLRFDCPD